MRPHCPSTFLAGPLHTSEDFFTSGWPRTHGRNWAHPGPQSTFAQRWVLHGSEASGSLSDCFASWKVEAVARPRSSSALSEMCKVKEGSQLQPLPQGFALSAQAVPLPNTW